MSRERTYSIFTWLLFICLITTACKQDAADDPAPSGDLKCVPTGTMGYYSVPNPLPITGWSVVNNDDGTVKEFRFGSQKEVLKRWALTYTGSRITKVVQTTAIFIGGPEVVSYVYYFGYSNKGYPDYKVERFEDKNPDTIRYEHDAEGRLVNSTRQRYVIGSTLRFEYDEHDNVTKIYRRGFDTAPDEFLILDNIQYDTRERYYAHSPELAFIDRYIFDNIPSANNPIAYRSHIFNSLPPTIQNQFTIKYDEHFRVKTITALIETEMVLLFSDMEYECEL